MSSSDGRLEQPGDPVSPDPPHSGAHRTPPSEPQPLEPQPLEPQPLEPQSAEAQPLEPQSAEAHGSDTPSASPDGDVSSAREDASAAPEELDRAIEIAGSFTPYSIGTPGNAFTRTVPLPEAIHGDTHDYVIDAMTVGDPAGTPRLTVRAASARGLAHQQYGDPRQDDHGMAFTTDGTQLVAVVCDGVSSGTWSHLAARIGAEDGSLLVARLLETTPAAEIDWLEVFGRLSRTMHDLCATLPSHDPQDVELTDRQVADKMATTIIIAVIGITTDDGTHPVTVVRFGDTSGWILDEDEGWIALGDIKNEGATIAESGTPCLPFVPAEAPPVVETRLGPGGVLVLMTDGVGDPLGSGRGEVGTALGRLWAQPPHPLEFASQVCFGRKSYDDDRGVLAIWPVVQP